MSDNRDVVHGAEHTPPVLPDQLSSGGMNEEAEPVLVRLNLSSSAENVPTVRQALAGFGEAIALQPLDLNDIRTALTEACNNASLHAYRGSDGPMEVELSASTDTVGVAVRDRGTGLPAEATQFEFHDTDAEELPGIGLPAIHSLATSVQVSERDGGGTEVAMSFDTPHIRISPGGPSAEGGELPELPEVWPANTVELEMAPLEAARWVFPRVLRAMAARAHFRIDRLADAQKIGELLLADPGWQPSDGVCAGITVTEEGIEFAVGPVSDVRASKLAAAVRRLEPEIGGLSDARLPVGPAKDERLGFAMARWH
ncbi:MAG TPA: ATP-binding protein [Solirubrobacteraceae bacterium]|jgi:serine/threonine-protein kinase RsbW